MDKIVKLSIEFETNNIPHSSPLLQPSGVIQSIKLVVKLMGTLETQEITEAISNFKKACSNSSSNSNSVSIFIS